MQFLTYGVGGLFWLACYGVAIWICVIGRKKNPNPGWNLIIAAEVLYIVVLFPFLYYRFFIDTLPIAFLSKHAQYIYYTSWVLILPIGMILSLFGLYFIAQGRKKKSTKAGKKRKGK